MPGGPETRGRDYVSGVVWESLEELEEVTRKGTSGHLRSD